MASDIWKYWCWSAMAEIKHSFPCFPLTSCILPMNCNDKNWYKNFSFAGDLQQQRGILRKKKRIRWNIIKYYWVSRVKKEVQIEKSATIERKCYAKYSDKNVNQNLHTSSNIQLWKWELFLQNLPGKQLISSSRLYLYTSAIMLLTAGLSNPFRTTAHLWKCP